MRSQGDRRKTRKFMRSQGDRRKTRKFKIYSKTHQTLGGYLPQGRPLTLFFIFGLRILPPLQSIGIKLSRTLL